MTLLDQLCGDIERVLRQRQNTPNPNDDLEAVLEEYWKHDPSVVQSALKCWVRGFEGRQTWLTEVVSKLDMEVIAILLYYGADPLQVCPRRDNSNAFNDALGKFFLTEDKEKAYFVLTLLNDNLPFQREYEYIFQNDALMGRFPDMTLFLERRDTALTYAAKHRFPYCTRWLIERRRASAHVRNSDGATPLDVAMEHFPRRPSSSESTLNYRTWEAQLRTWALLTRILAVSGHADIKDTEWRQKYPEAFGFFQDMVFSTI